ncbi:Reverse transcriptase domain-containing protein [Durusdinium trenchii]|uniref:Reverse transcriptase domain-containing protein n=1 Tax=Durusdinium trenchii TaxID=1381693 RepID=A0ABP0RGU4_9DINO
MDAFLFATTLALAWLPAHLHITKSDWPQLCTWISHWLRPLQKDQQKEQRVEEEMMKVRQRNYKLLTRWFSHLSMVVIFVLIHDAIAAPRFNTICPAICWGVGYLQHLLVGGAWVDLTPRRLTFLSYFLHGMLLTIYSSEAATAANAAISGSLDLCHFAFKQGFYTTIRFVLIFGLLDPWTSVPFQLLFTIAEVLAYLVVFGSKVPVGLLCFGEVFIFMVGVISSIFIDMVLRERIYAMLDTADAESLICGFRRVLRGLCDGEVLLDSHMTVRLAWASTTPPQRPTLHNAGFAISALLLLRTIAQESECLKHLILTDVSLKGRCFGQLLADEERARFDEFVDSSTNAFGLPESKHSAPPFCSRVSFRGSAGIRVAADVYHVPVPGLFGASEPHHLIAFKEDTESRPQPEAGEGSIPAELLHRISPLQCRPPDAASASGSSRASNLETCRELCEMTLLINAETEPQDVEEAHLRYRRDEEPADIATALQSGMPSLRKMVKPTDWEKMRSSVVRFAERASHDPMLS